jgi:colicin import membrane protein
MSEQKESSVLFSLKELMNLEEDRIRGEEADKSAQIAAQEEARRAAEAAARNAEEARIRAEEERRRAEEQRSREEAARLDAIRHAEVEKARLEAEQQARLAAMASQQQHERQLAVINTDKKNTRFRNILIGTIAAVLVVGGVAGFMVNKANEESKAKIAAAEQAKREQEAETNKLKAQLDDQAAKVKNLQSAMENEKDEHKKKLLQAQLEAAKEEEADIGKKLGGGRPAGGPAAGGDKPPPPKAACTCKSTDPLCDCL